VLKSVKKKEKSSKSREEELVDKFWNDVVRPILDIAVETTQMSVYDLVTRLIETNTTLGYLAQVYDFKKWIKKIPFLFDYVRDLAKNATPREVDEFINYVLSEVLPRKDPGLAQLIKERGFMWFRQSIFELWQLFKSS